MLAVLKRHPFPVEAHFHHCLVLTYTLPAAVLRPLLPPFLTLDTHGPWGFLAVAMVQTRNLRPAGWPRRLGQDFFLIGYRAFVRLAIPGRAALRGLYILRSDTDRRMMKALGNLLTHYRYRCSNVSWRAGAEQIEVRVATTNAEADLHVVASLRASEDGRFQSSVFNSPHEARRFAGPLPYTFDYERSSRHMTLIRGLRRNWRPRPVNASVYQQAFVDALAPPGVSPILAAAFYVHDVPYRWERGVRVACRQSQLADREMCP